MMDDHASPHNYYFVPFGREPGGLLETLGLPPMASEEAVADAHSRRRAEIAAEYVTRRLPLARQMEYTTLKGKAQRGDIDEAALKAERARLIDGSIDPELWARVDYAALLVQRDELPPNKYKNRLAQLVARVKGKTYGNDFLHGRLTEEEYQTMVARLAVPVDEEALHEQRNATLAELEAADLTEAEFEQLDTELKAAKTAAETQLNELNERYRAVLARRRERERAGIVVEATIWQHLPVPDGDRARRVVLIEGADALWGKRPHPHSRWDERIVSWTAELGALPPRLSLDAGNVPRRPPPFPSLYRPFPLDIDRLESAAADESGPPPAADMTADEQAMAAAVLAELLRRALAGKTGQPGEPRDLPANEFDEFMRFVAETAARNQKPGDKQ